MNVIDQTAPGGIASATLASRVVDANSDLVFAGNVSRLIAGTGTDSNPNATGHFTGGTSATGQLLPAVNRDAQQPNASYTGGIGIADGIILSTGLVDDQLDNQIAQDSLAEGLGIGAEGPNNGFNFSFNTGANVNLGEVNARLGMPQDLDFETEFESFGNELHPNSQDANVLSFNVTLNKPGYLRLSFAFASDEWDDWLELGFNDIAMIFVDGKNILRFKKNVGGTVEEILLDLAEISTCPFFVENDVVPAPDNENFNLDASEHHNDSFTYYDHEYGGFTKVLTRESELLNVGTHNVKIIIHDVRDNQVDSAIFIPDDSLKLFAFLKGDYNLNGTVDAADYVIWRDHQGMTNAKVTDGDGDGNGIVNSADYDVWRAGFGMSGGNRDFCADFNRDGAVNFADAAKMMGGLTKCASRFEGDANGDGAVDQCDIDIFQAESMSQTPLETCDCGQQMAAGGGEMMMALSTSELAELDAQIPMSADMDGDGSVDAHDMAELDAAIYAAFDNMKAAKDVTLEEESTADPEPTLAEPQPEFAPTNDQFAPSGPTSDSADEKPEPVPVVPHALPGVPVMPNSAR
jgi:hypothetical protein